MYCAAPLSRKHGRVFDVNKKSVFTMRRIGRGWSALNKFCGIMNMPPAVCESVFNHHQRELQVAAETVSERPMNRSAAEIRVLAGGDQIAVSFDGTWMRRGYSSLYGEFACISFLTGRILDVHVSSRYCQQCSVWCAKREKGTITQERFEEWKASHQCGSTTTVSAPAMKTEAASIIWNRSHSSRQLLYTTYIGDGKGD